MATNQPDTDNVVSDDNGKEINLDSNSAAQQEDDDKIKEGLKNRDEKSVDGVDEKGKEEDKNDSSYDNDRDYDYDYDYPQYSYQEEIDNFIYGTPDERAVDEYLDNHHNWMED